MSKDIKKRISKRDIVKTIAVRQIAELFEVDKSYIYGILSGHHTHGQSAEIKKAYTAKYDEIKSVLES